MGKVGHFEWDFSLVNMCFASNLTWVNLLTGMILRNSLKTLIKLKSVRPFISICFNRL